MGLKIDKVTLLRTNLKKREKLYKRESLKTDISVWFKHSLHCHLNSSSLIVELNQESCTGSYDRELVIIAIPRTDEDYREASVRQKLSMRK